MQNQIGGAIPQNLQNGISSPAVSPQANPNMGYNDIFYQMEQSIGAEVSQVKNLVQQGLITQQQGHNLLTQLVGKAQKLNMYKNSQQINANPAGIVNNPAQAMPQALNPMDLFNQERPGFFDAEGRGDVLNYIKGFDMDKDEILRIAQLVEGLENSAVDKYLKKSAYEKSLNDENALAKSKLTAYAQNAPGDQNFNRIFTREEIGRMSGEEFNQNEKMIMDQVKQGLIR